MNQFALDPVFSDEPATPPEAPQAAPEASAPSATPQDMMTAIGEAGSAVAADVRAGTSEAQPQKSPFMDNALFRFEDDLAEASNVPLFKAFKPAQALTGAAIKVGEGVVTLTEAGAQIGLDTAEKLGIVPRGTADDWKFMDEEEKKAVDRQFKADFGDHYGFAVAEATGAILPFFLLPTKTIPPEVQGLFKRLILGGMLGTAENAAQGLFQPVSGDTIDERNAQRGGNALMSGAIGGGARVVTEAVTWGKNWIPNAIKAAYDNGGRELYERGVQVSKRTGVKYKLSQLLQDPEIEMLERGARAGMSGERVARNIENQQAFDAKAYFEGLLREMPERMGRTVENAFFRVLGNDKEGLVGARLANAKKNFAAAKGAGAEIYLENTFAKIDEIIARYQKPGMGPGAPRAAKLAQQLRNDLAMNGGGLVDPENLQMLLERYGAATKGKENLFGQLLDKETGQTIAKQVFGALNDDLDLAVTQGLKGAEELRFARDQYRVDTGAIESLEETALGKLFGTKAQPTLEDVETAVKNMDPTEIRQTLGILGKTNPAGKERLQQFWLKQAFENARVEGPAGGADFIPAKMLDLRSPGSKNSSYTARDTFDAVFPEGDPMRQSVLDGVEAVKYLMVNNNNTGGVTRVKLRQLAYAVTNMNAGAGAAFVSDLLTPSFIGKMVMDPDSVRALDELTKPLETARHVAAMNVIFNRWINTTSEEERQ